LFADAFVVVAAVAAEAPVAAGVALATVAAAAVAAEVFAAPPHAASANDAATSVTRAHLISTFSVTGMAQGHHPAALVA